MNQPPQQLHERAIYLRGKWLTGAKAHALALKLFNEKNFKAAGDIYIEIVHRQPQDFWAWFHLGFCRQKLRQFEKALESYDKALALQENYAEAHTHRGVTLHELGRFNEALESYAKALLLKPDQDIIYNYRGMTLQELRRYDEALADSDRALELKTDVAALHYNRGKLMQTMKRYDEASISFAKALELQPKNVVLYIEIGNLLISKGDMIEAEKCFLQALALRPESAEAFYSLSLIRRYEDPGHAHIKNIQSLLNSPATPPADKEYLYFALGKIYDDCGNYDDAFSCYREANASHNSRVSYDVDRTVTATDAIMAVFNKEFLRQSFPFASDTNVPVFIVGMPRSGTTLTASILSNHRSVATAGELSTIDDFALALKAAETEASYPHAVRHFTPDKATCLINDYLKRLSRDVGSGVLHIVDKFPLNFRHLGLIAMLFPKARIIHCTRDPLDTSLSNYFQRFPKFYDYSFDLQNIGHFHGQYARLMKHWSQVLPIDVIEISYENLIKNTEATTRKMLEALELEWDDHCLEPHTNPCAVETASNWQVRQPIYQQSLERWRHYEKHLSELKEMLHPGCGA
jgi:tetratricopeptide (TPR) repeat protein